MSSLTNLNIGYDIRVSLKESSERWNNQRKKDFLFKEDVDYILSVDSDVWQRPSNIESVEYSFGHQMLWLELAELEEFFDKTNLKREDFSIISIQLALKENFNDMVFREWDQISKDVLPSNLKVEWQLLGYDIADKWLLSSLSNCGFLADNDNLPSLVKEKWKNSLNNYHLFTELDKAFAFKDYSNQRVAEHAPFFVFSLYLMTQTV